MAKRPHPAVTAISPALVIAGAIAVVLVPLYLIGLAFGAILSVTFGDVLTIGIAGYIGYWFGRAR